jgi:hypothetical protein
MTNNNAETTKKICNTGVVGFQEVSCECEKHKKPSPMVRET